MATHKIGIFCPSLASDLAAEIESNTCPICFELMKSPDFPPIVLSSCGHSFCAKRLIDSFVSLQYRRQPTPPQPPQDEQEKAHFLNKLSAAETRSEILQKELAAAVERKKLLESELCNIDKLYRRFKRRLSEAKKRLRKVTAENESVDKEIKLLNTEIAEIQKHMVEENVRSALVDYSLKELKTYRLRNEFTVRLMNGGRSLDDVLKLKSETLSQR